MTPPSGSSSTSTRGRPPSSTHTPLQAARSSGVCRSSTAIRSAQLALPYACALRYSRNPARSAAAPIRRSRWVKTIGAFW